MRIAILSHSDSWYLADLRRAAEPRHEVMVASFRELSSSIGDRVRVFAGKQDLHQADAVLVRTMPPGSLEQIVFRMDALAQLEASGIPVINPPKSLEVAVDKYLALARIARSGALTPQTISCQTVEQAMAAMDLLGGDVVIKPLFGSEGRGIARLNDPALARRAFGMLVELGAALYVQQFVPHEGFDVRVLLVGKRALAMRRRHPTDWRTNISRGAIAEPVELHPHWLEIAQRAADAVGAPIAGVDLLPGSDGRLYVIEVNAVPGWKALAEVTKTDVARWVIEYLESTASNRPAS